MVGNTFAQWSIRMFHLMTGCWMLTRRTKKVNIQVNQT